MANLKVYLKAAKSYTKSAIRSRKIPFEVFHKVNFACNLKCKYCGLPQNAYRIKEMNTEQIKTAIKEFAEAGTIAWSFSGGEPLVRKDIGELVNYAKDNGLFVNLVTNGVLFKDKLNDIKKADKIFFSLDGPKEINDRTRGKGTYGQVIEAVKLAKNENFDVTIQTLICRENVQNNFYGLRCMIDLAEDLKVRVLFHPIYIHDYNRKFIGKYVLSPKENIAALNLIKKMKNESRAVGRNSSVYDEWIKKLKDGKMGRKCLAGKKYCYLLPDGRVAPCLFKLTEAADGVKHGFVNAFNRINSDHDCSCASFFSDRDLLYSLNFISLLKLNR